MIPSCHVLKAADSQGQVGPNLDGLKPDIKKVLLSVTNGKGILNKSGELEEIKKGDVVYIAGNAKHALKNIGTKTLEFYWIFPTDTFSEVEYFN